MRHRNVNKILDRKKGPREALLRSLATSLVLYEKIKTTDGKAATIKPIVERLITKGKVNNLASRRYLLAHLYGENAVKKVLEELAPRYKDRKGGYTRIIKISARSGDAAKIVQIEFV
ncbi:MAG: 50S ribosomal protein L17 [Candidatus Parcubacteria bacterium]|nr:50S ribosomal protein L17 [Candidatus Parcubacteria bacterium]